MIHQSPVQNLRPGEMDDFIIPQPILFNPLKHHLGYINNFIDNFSRRNLGNLGSTLSIIGGSQMDLYSGLLSLEELVNEIIIIITNRKIDSKDSYIKYIHEYNGFDRITLADGSSWVLKVGKVPGRFVHIHPARYSLHSLRIKANTLKTLIAAKIATSGEIGLNELNKVRLGLLGLEEIRNPMILDKYRELFSK